MARAKRYDESSISVLKGLEPVKQSLACIQKPRIRCISYRRLLIIARTEAIGGYATEISIECHDDKSFSVTDNGRGIPVGMHPEEKFPL